MGRMTWYGKREALGPTDCLPILRVRVAMVALQLPFQRVVDGPVLKLFGQAESRCHTLNRPGSELVPAWQAEEVMRYLT